MRPRTVTHLVIAMFLLLGLVAEGFTQEQEAPLTVQECVDLALQRNPVLKSAREEINANKQIERAAFKDFLPKFEATYNYTYNKNVPTIVFGGTEIPIGAQDQYDAFIGIRQPIFAGGSIYYNYQLAKLGVDTSKIDYSRRKMDLILDVKITYYNILRTEQNRREAEESVNRLTAHLNDAKDFFAVGLIAKNDVLQSEVQLAQARQDLVRAEQAQRLAVSRMNVILERELDDPLKLAEGLEYRPFPLPFEKGLAMAYEQRPEIIAGKVAVERSEKTISLAESAYFPNISITARYKRSADDSDLNNNPYGIVENVTALTSLTWTFFEWGKTRNLVAESKSRLNQARYALIQVTDSVRLEVKQTFLDLEEAEKNIGFARIAIEQAEENYRLNQERYKVQVATSTDVLDAQGLLTRARTNYYNALAQYDMARARVERVIGLETSNP